jgi:flagellar motor protein MotB
VKRRSRGEDATVWIGYADFLTTLAILFFVLVVGVSAKLAPLGAGYLEGTVRDAETGRAIAKCAADLGTGRQDSTDVAGRFRFTVDSLRGPLTVGLGLACTGYARYSEVLSLVPDSTRRREVRLAPKKDVGVETLPGDALFEPNESVLKPEAVDTIVSLGTRLKQGLASDEVIAVQGHTDDVPFQSGASDNWVLSGARAAAAAKVLTDRVGITECQVAIMGFGPSRPVAVVAGGDTLEERRRKRARNRRIEFRRLRGSDIIGGQCAR